MALAKGARNCGKLSIAGEFSGVECRQKIQMSFHGPSIINPAN
jgi:hypothetical protein